MIINTLELEFSQWKDDTNKKSNLEITELKLILEKELEANNILESQDADEERTNSAAKKILRTLELLLNYTISYVKEIILFGLKNARKRNKRKEKRGGGI